MVSSIIQYGNEWTILLISIITLIVAKLLFTLYLGKRIYDKRKESGKIELDFRFAVFFFSLSFCIARIMFMYFDFFMTSFDPNLYYLSPNIIVWKLAILIAQSSIALLYFIVDLKVLKFKLKGIFAYIIMVITLIQVFYPVSSQAEFELVSTLGMIGQLLVIFVPLIFFYVGYKSPALRKTSYMVAIGILIFFIGGLILNGSIVSLIGSTVLAYFMSSILKIIGLLLFVYGSIKFVL